MVVDVAKGDTRQFGPRPSILALSQQFEVKTKEVLS